MAFHCRFPKPTQTANGSRCASQRGAVAVEFALVMAVFLTLVLGIFEIGRMMLLWNSAVEATTMGARVAAVCKVGSAVPATKMDAVLPGLSASGAVKITYLGRAGSICDGTMSSPCYQVQANLDSSKLIQSFSTPLLSWVIGIPSFSTTLTSEELDSLPSNSVCY